MVKEPYVMNEEIQMYTQSVLPPMRYRPFSFCGNIGSNFTASARFVKGAVATIDT